MAPSATPSAPQRVPSSSATRRLQLYRRQGGCLPSGAEDERANLAHLYKSVRRKTELLAGPLTAEDQIVQSMPDASPTKWHRAHTTWFFETVVLAALQVGYVHYDTRYSYLFNSYYESLGHRHPRAERGLLTRPSCEDVAAYRACVDECMLKFIETASSAIWEKAAPLIALGLNHEQQHQELLLTDILHAFSRNPCLPAYRTATPDRAWASRAHWVSFPGGDHWIGYAGHGFAFDNEGPSHRVVLSPFALASRPVTNAEWLAFMADNGYGRVELWLSDGWAIVQSQHWAAPLYWRYEAETWMRFSLHGLNPVDQSAPVANISFYEADAYARWCGNRLPTEAEWEIAAYPIPIEGNLLDQDRLEPTAFVADGLAQMFGDVWEWTQSPYMPYPGFRPTEGTISEYNGKFMVNQMVLRGGSCLTPAGHIRATYRNFFYPGTRWQFAGLRLAKDI